MDELIAAVRQGHTVPLLADRDLSRRGIEVDFLGGRTKMPAGPALLASTSIFRAPRSCLDRSRRPLGK